MKRVWIMSGALIGSLVLSGCDRPDGRASASASPAANATGPQEAQPKLPTVKLWLGTQEIAAEIALTLRQIETGMMFRTNISESEAMLFVFAAPHQASFWMKNVPLALSCAYLDPEGIILEIRDMHPQDTNPIVARSERVQFVLETARGWFERHQVSTGALVRTEMGSLRETFFGADRRRR